MTVIGQNSDGLVSAPSFYEWLEKKGIKLKKKSKMISLQSPTPGVIYAEVDVD